MQRSGGFPGLASRDASSRDEGHPRQTTSTSTAESDAPRPTENVPPETTISTDGLSPLAVAAKYLGRNVMKQPYYLQPESASKPLSSSVGLPISSSLLEYLTKRPDSGQDNRVQFSPSKWTVSRVPEPTDSLYTQTSQVASHPLKARTDHSHEAKDGSPTHRSPRQTRTIPGSRPQADLVSIAKQPLTHESDYRGVLIGSIVAAARAAGEVTRAKLRSSSPSRNFDIPSEVHSDANSYEESRQVAIDRVLSPEVTVCPLSPAVQLMPPEPVSVTETREYKSLPAWARKLLPPPSATSLAQHAQNQTSAQNESNLKHPEIDFLQLKLKELTAAEKGSAEELEMVLQRTLAGEPPKSPEPAPEDFAVCMTERPLPSTIPADDGSANPISRRHAPRAAGVGQQRPLTAHPMKRRLVSSVRPTSAQVHCGYSKGTIETVHPRPASPSIRFAVVPKPIETEPELRTTPIKPLEHPEQMSASQLALAVIDLHSALVRESTHPGPAPAPATASTADKAHSPKPARPFSASSVTTINIEPRQVQQRPSTASRSSVRGSSAGIIPHLQFPVMPVATAPSFRRVEVTPSVGDDGEISYSPPSLLITPARLQPSSFPQALPSRALAPEHPSSSSTSAAEPIYVADSGPAAVQALQTRFPPESVSRSRATGSFVPFAIKRKDPTTSSDSARLPYDVSTVSPMVLTGTYLPGIRGFKPKKSFSQVPNVRSSTPRSAPIFAGSTWIEEMKELGDFSTDTSSRNNLQIDTRDHQQPQVHAIETQLDTVSESLGEDLSAGRDRARGSGGSGEYTPLPSEEVVQDICQTRTTSPSLRPPSALRTPADVYATLQHSTAVGEMRSQTPSSTSAKRVPELHLDSVLRKQMAHNTESPRNPSPMQGSEAVSSDVVKDEIASSSRHALTSRSRGLGSVSLSGRSPMPSSDRSSLALSHISSTHSARSVHNIRSHLDYSRRTPSSSSHIARPATQLDPVAVDDGTTAEQSHTSLDEASPSPLNDTEVPNRLSINAFLEMVQTHEQVDAKEMRRRQLSPSSSKTPASSSTRFSFSSTPLRSLSSSVRSSQEVLGDKTTQLAAAADPSLKQTSSTSKDSHVPTESSSVLKTSLASEDSKATPSEGHDATDMPKAAAMPRRSRRGLGLTSSMPGGIGFEMIRRPFNERDAYLARESARRRASLKMPTQAPLIHIEDSNPSADDSFASSITEHEPGSGQTGDTPRPHAPERQKSTQTDGFRRRRASRVGFPRDLPPRRDSASQMVAMIAAAAAAAAAAVAAGGSPTAAMTQASSLLPKQIAGYGVVDEGLGDAESPRLTGSQYEAAAAAAAAALSAAASVASGARRASVTASDNAVLTRLLSLASSSISGQATSLPSSGSGPSQPSDHSQPLQQPSDGEAPILEHPENQGDMSDQYVDDIDADAQIAAAYWAAYMARAGAVQSELASSYRSSLARASRRSTISASNQEGRVVESGADTPSKSSTEGSKARAAGPGMASSGSTSSLSSHPESKSSQKGLEGSVGGGSTQTSKTGSSRLSYLDPDARLAAERWAAYMRRGAEAYARRQLESSGSSRYTASSLSASLRSVGTAGSTLAGQHPVPRRRSAQEDKLVLEWDDHTFDEDADLYSGSEGDVEAEDQQAISSDTSDEVAKDHAKAAVVRGAPHGATTDIEQDRRSSVISSMSAVSSSNKSSAGGSAGATSQQQYPTGQYDRQASVASSRAGHRQSFSSTHSSQRSHSRVGSRPASRQLLNHRADHQVADGASEQANQAPEAGQVSGMDADDDDDEYERTAIKYWSEYMRKANERRLAALTSSSVSQRSLANRSPAPMEMDDDQQASGLVDSAKLPYSQDQTQPLSMYQTHVSVQQPQATETAGALQQIPEQQVSSALVESAAEPIRLPVRRSSTVMLLDFDGKPKPSGGTAQSPGGVGNFPPHSGPRQRTQTFSNSYSQAVASTAGADTVSSARSEAPGSRSSTSRHGPTIEEQRRREERRKKRLQDKRRLMVLEKVMRGQDPANVDLFSDEEEDEDKELYSSVSVSHMSETADEAFTFDEDYDEDYTTSQLGSTSSQQYTPSIGYRPSRHEPRRGRRRDHGEGSITTGTESTLTSSLQSLSGYSENTSLVGSITSSDVLTASTQNSEVHNRKRVRALIRAAHRAEQEIKQDDEWVVPHEQATAAHSKLPTHLKVNPDLPTVGDGMESVKQAADTGPGIDSCAESGVSQGRESPEGGKPSDIPSDQGRGVPERSGETSIQAQESENDDGKDEDQSQVPSAVQISNRMENAEVSSNIADESPTSQGAHSIQTSELLQSLQFRVSPRPQPSPRRLLFAQTPREPRAKEANADTAQSASPQESLKLKQPLIFPLVEPHDSARWSVQATHYATLPSVLDRGLELTQRRQRDALEYLGIRRADQHSDPGRVTATDHMIERHLLTLDEHARGQEKRPEQDAMEGRSPVPVEAVRSLVEALVQPGPDRMQEVNSILKGNRQDDLYRAAKRLSPLPLLAAKEAETRAQEFSARAFAFCPPTSRAATRLAEAAMHAVVRSGDEEPRDQSVRGTDLILSSAPIVTGDSSALQLGLGSKDRNSRVQLQAARLRASLPESIRVVVGSSPVTTGLLAAMLNAGNTGSGKSSELDRTSHCDHGSTQDSVVEITRGPIASPRLVLSRESRPSTAKENRIRSMKEALEEVVRASKIEGKSSSNHTDDVTLMESQQAQVAAWAVDLQARYDRVSVRELTLPRAGATGSMEHASPMEDQTKAVDIASVPNEHAPSVTEDYVPIASLDQEFDFSFSKRAFSISKERPKTTQSQVESKEPRSVRPHSAVLSPRSNSEFATLDATRSGAVPNEVSPHPADEEIFWFENPRSSKALALSRKLAAQNVLLREAFVPPNRPNNETSTTISDAALALALTSAVLDNKPGGAPLSSRSRSTSSVLHADAHPAGLMRSLLSAAPTDASSTDTAYQKEVVSRKVVHVEPESVRPALSKDARFSFVKFKQADGTQTGSAHFVYPEGHFTPTEVATGRLARQLYFQTSNNTPIMKTTKAARVPSQSTAQRTQSRVQQLHFPKRFEAAPYVHSITMAIEAHGDVPEKSTESCIILASDPAPDANFSRSAAPIARPRGAVAIVSKGGDKSGLVADIQHARPGKAQSASMPPNPVSNSIASSLSSSSTAAPNNTPEPRAKPRGPFAVAFGYRNVVEDTLLRGR